MLKLFLLTSEIFQIYFFFLGNNVQSCLVRILVTNLVCFNGDEQTFSFSFLLYSFIFSQLFQGPIMHAQLTAENPSSQAFKLDFGVGACDTHHSFFSGIFHSYNQKMLFISTGEGTSLEIWGLVVSKVLFCFYIFF